MKLLLIFLGIVLIVIGYFGIQKKEYENNKKTIKEEEPLELTFKNAGIGSSEDILKQRETWENQFEQKPGEIYDNIFNGKIIGLLSS